MTVSALLYGYKSWVMRKKDDSHNQAIEMKFQDQSRGATERIEYILDRLGQT